MKSMTGFGRGVYADSRLDLTFCVEISSINRKQLDVHAGLPGELSGLEPCLRRLIRERLHRGAVNVRVTVQFGPKAAATAIVVNTAMLTALVDKTRQLARQLGLDNEIRLQDFLALPGAVEVGGPDFSLAETEPAFSRAVNLALDALLDMKSREGDHLRSDIEQRLEFLRRAVERITPLAAAIPTLQRDKLRQRLEAAGLPLDCNDERILREIVIYCDRADVTEEITRLHSHFTQFESYLHQEDGVIGRSLDFLIQEINREITTMGNKAAGCEISPIVVKMKTELEKIREQVQNVE
ncbi:MAG: YicC family protein [Victivallales bacterium]|nr:YicC family protein [Victivallales bacterium]